MIVERQDPVGVRVDVDEAGGDDEAAGVDRVATAERAGDRERRDAPVLDADVGGEAGPARAVDDVAATHHEVEFAGHPTQAITLG